MENRAPHPTKDSKEYPIKGMGREEGVNLSEPIPISVKIHTRLQTLTPKRFMLNMLKSILYFRPKGSKSIPFGEAQTCIPYQQEVISPRPGFTRCGWADSWKNKTPRGRFTRDVLVTTVTICLNVEINKNANVNTRFSIANGVTCIVSKITLLTFASKTSKNDSLRSNLVPRSPTARRVFSHF